MFACAGSFMISCGKILGRLPSKPAGRAAGFRFRTSRFDVEEYHATASIVSACCKDLMLPSSGVPAASNLDLYIHHPDPASNNACDRILPAVHARRNMLCVFRSLPPQFIALCSPFDTRHDGVASVLQVIQAAT